MSEKPMLEIKKLSAWYAKNELVLSDFSMELLQNEIVGLIGLNGAGKTTLMKVLSGVHENYSQMKQEWNGTSFHYRNSNWKKNRYVVFAEDHSFQYFTFLEYLDYVSKSYGSTLNTIEVEKLIDGFHFEEYTKVLLRELSTGNRKKVSLITAFALHPQLLLLDEPVNGLDYTSTEFLYQLMGSYRTYGTILFSSHILESICLTCDRVLVLEHGKIDKIFQEDEIQAKKIREVLKLEG